ncbi:bifunctional tRNA (5-methylaminomethyl-2-thiouridine)(34)-methyltransferase MnmD/FAD-dependent 5-carboxymethylaminomethyl-2-thiouridine(34) oxidoreductase MnmC [Endozoicomonas sp. SM1973]|uniref:tRNA 5-methylaminomethyl-2-thiouridine biosynthesis bifunctional protein MnmC n=1 Tax=Spartinivicinus marinus TaxID=2994442 RepID=A0A853HYL1_9GAMM|nr:bifunctional tRNA (5-methylaminomethyl-2-thiouridine)(34)-methyltransferase MnmD/FAD-dependent 5-carboxymethylaminomethyl-2-thiouridine(34) oxidoreductase MnmC [Spartinivicinus marinus]MCX4028968.1 bifunctional tRNA (5-methylaminomethyl-2-thiouridine)(34)-methyltransferase MnmD/FAD-dependent 5-carboxymethylaminomethyl-2-thiouridine(34) oxidoreductase MnmC [Spartinivicinus marinus]NYZ65449.1 bifunctional tRNA (5-methylaminomethyl-2-thiouridine)(34)-methyltransferase MnmD/FAD-dependent 5-carboxy
MSSQQPPHAELSWDSQGLPIATTFDDVYFSKTNGLAETRYVFLAHNQLAERWQNLRDNFFTIAETGFGTSLNFLCAWQLWQQHAPTTAQLHYISCEQYPLTRQDLLQALALWPELAPFANELLTQYQILGPGIYRFQFANGKVLLTLLIGDANESLPQLDGSVNAWFLDGFAPAKNPALWQPSLFQAMANKSTVGSTFSTFTAAGIVRRGLQAAGFTVSKVKGFGSKRDMLCGIKENTISSGTTTKTPWFDRPQPLQAAQAKQALVVGAGLAGASTAEALRLRGFKVTVLDQQTAPAEAASGNPQGVLYAKLSAHLTPLNQLVNQGYRFSLQWLNNIQQQLPQQPFWSACGVIQLAFNDKEAERQQAIINSGLYPESMVQAATAAMLSQLAGTEIKYPGLFFPEAGWVSPKQLSTSLLQQPGICFIPQAEIIDIQWQADAQQWYLTDHQQRQWQAPVVVIAGGTLSNQLKASRYLKLAAIRGQTSYFPVNEISQQLNTVICGDGYLAPAFAGQHLVGATFNHHTTTVALTAEDHLLNLNRLQQLAPNCYTACQQQQPTGFTTGRVGFRCTTPDFLPVIGPLVTEQAFIETYGDLRKNARQPFTQPAPYQPGLFVTTGHGSRGLISAPLAGEILACYVTGEPMPVSHELLAALHPSRFLVKDLIKRKR